MKDSNFLKENNARHVWHPMAHPADSQTNLPTILTGGRDVFITDVDEHEVLGAAVAPVRRHRERDRRRGLPARLRPRVPEAVRQRLPV